MNDRIASCALAAYSALPRNVKPLRDQATCLAAIVAKDGAGSLNTVALATGTSCLPRTKLIGGGGVLFDSHAEVCSSGERIAR